MINYFDDRQRYNCEPVYTRREMDTAIEQCRRACRVNRVILKRDGFDVALQIVSFRATPEGVIMEVA